MAENNSKTFIIGIVVFVLLVIGGFAFFAKKDVPVEQTQAEMTAAPEGTMMEAPAAPEAAPAADVAPAPEAAPAAEAAPATEAPATEATPEATPAPTPVPTPADEPTAAPETAPEAAPAQ